MRVRKELLLIVITLTDLFSVNAQNPVNFKLISATDKSEFILNNEKGKFITLHFLLKTECPFCLRHTQEYFSRAGTLPNVLQVFIKPDTEADIKAWSGKLPADELIRFPIYRDPEANLARQFNIPFGYVFHNQVVHYPATVLLGPDGNEVFRYVGKDNSDRLSFDQLAEKVRELTK
ncbi:MAG: hypothetical protein A2X05_06955 [Bacteroidetes bacterium GWE2_41_25]|nr:MAG: hypothetical protein A2X03_08210 [Bacteroidetes bacterium GWA2_40_15]OFX98573.1 MAG: hypothetical protein A2X06_03375 [Bacteroidetes bacterium GWC2_40_22]OFY02227.1 MAG: hypothetical protein A2X05_06955 [Bacteroidetes bacterium GWE2_41_25]OFY60360.1 MAG: hypothetical protein A2X04_08080 [Bacteroidetes bacterium GWF2_41_9]HAM09389.1 hypothetical protein [Bacteroidales bacterium]